jgi:hypothetical protein
MARYWIRKSGKDTSFSCSTIEELVREIKTLENFGNDNRGKDTFICATDISNFKEFITLINELKYPIWFMNIDGDILLDAIEDSPSILFWDCKIRSLKITNSLIKQLSFFSYDYSYNFTINYLGIVKSVVDSVDIYRVRQIGKIHLYDSNIHHLKINSVLGERPEIEIGILEFINLTDFWFSILNCRITHSITIQSIKNKVLPEKSYPSYFSDSKIQCQSIEISSISSNINFIKSQFINSTRWMLYKNTNSIISINSCIFTKENTFSFLNPNDARDALLKMVIRETIFKDLPIFDEGYALLLEFYSTHFLNNIFISTTLNSYNNKTLANYHKPKEIHSSVYCIFKNKALQSNDKIGALYYRKLEMDAYTRELFLEPKKCQEKTILILNKISNNHGLSWTRGVGFTIGTALVFYYLYYIAKNDFHLSSNYISYYNVKEFIINAIQFLWIPEGIKDLPNELFLSKSWYSFLTMILSFFLGKILIAYGIYQTVAAFRKHGKI